MIVMWLIYITVPNHALLTDFGLLFHDLCAFLPLGLMIHAALMITSCRLTSLDLSLPVPVGARCFHCEVRWIRSSQSDHPD